MPFRRALYDRMLPEVSDSHAELPPDAGALCLRPVRWLNAPLLTALLAIAATGLAGALIIHDQSLGTTGVAPGFTLILATAAAICIWLNARRADDRRVTLHADGLLVPLSRGFGRRARVVRFDELSSVELIRPPTGAELVLNVRGRWPVRIRRRQLIRGDIEQLYRALLIRASTENPELEAAQLLFMRRHRVPMVSLLAGMILVLVFLASSAGEDDPVHRLVVLGGINDWLVARGEVYRLGAAAVLSADWPHLLINVALLIVIGLRLEYVTGPLPFAGALVSGLLAGNVCAYLIGGQTVVIGASGGIFGLLALYADTLYRFHRHLPTRTQFAPNVYLAAVLALLFIPLPGYAQSVHVGGFVGGLAWVLATRVAPRTLLLLSAAAGASFVGLSSWHGFDQAPRWRSAEEALIEQMAEDPSARRGTLDLVGWYALRHAHSELMPRAVERLQQLESLDASSAGTLAELLLARGEPEAAARRANESFELRGDRAAAERLMRAELAAYASTCVPSSYTAQGESAPLPRLEAGVLEFISSNPLYVHARVGRTYVMVPAGIPVKTAVTDVDDVVVLGYSDAVPLSRRPRVQHITSADTGDACAIAEAAR